MNLARSVTPSIKIWQGAILAIVEQMCFDSESY